MAEIWDGYYEDGSLAGVDLVRGEPIPNGLYHLVAEVLVRHRDGDYLLMQRSLTKEMFPGFWEATAGGSALKGETAEECVRRELREETGIIDGELTRVNRQICRGDTIFCTYLWVTDWEKSAITLQEGETQAFRWLDEAAFKAFIRSGEMVNTQRDRWVDYFREIGYME